MSSDRARSPALTSFVVASRYMPVYVALLLLLIVASIWAPATLSGVAVRGIAPYGAVLGLAALGQMLVIMTGGIDLSVPGTMSLAAVIMVGVGDGSNENIWIAIATAIAVPVGVLLGALPPVERTIRPVLEFLRPIPSVAIIPLAILLIPVDELMKVSVIVYAAVWPILINTIDAVSSVSPRFHDVGRSCGASRWSTLRHITLPAALPQTLTGMRIASSTSSISPSCDVKPWGVSRRPAL